MYADLCDIEHIKDLKKLAEQVSVSYEYIDNTDKILSGDGESYSINSYSISTNFSSLPRILFSNSLVFGPVVIHPDIFVSFLYVS